MTRDEETRPRGAVGDGPPLELDMIDREIYRKALLRESISPEEAEKVKRMEIMHLLAHDPHNPGQPIALDPREAMRQVAFEGYELIIQRLQYMRFWANSFYDLAVQYAHARPSGEHGLRVITDRGLINASIGSARSKVKDALFTAQPGPRPEAVLEASKLHDGELLERGVHLRTIYPASARAREPESRWAEHMTSLGAEIRTCPVPFPRILYLQGVAAYISDVQPGTDPEVPPAIEVTHPAMLAWIHMVYTQYWDLSQPWKGDRPRGHGNGQTTDPRDRTVLRLLCNGATRARVQKEVGLSERGLRDVLSRLRADFGAKNDFELAMKWRDSDDYRVP